MFLSTQLRIIRRRHKISLIELAEKAGLSNQKISSMELAKLPVSERHETAMNLALAKLIAVRKVELALLEQDCLLNRGHLLDPIEVQSDES